VLVPLDRSQATEAALPAAERIARNLGADVVLLAVGELPESSEQKDDSRRQTTRIFANARPHFDGLAVRHREDLHEDPASAILAAIDEEGADMVVMASDGKAGRTSVARPEVAESLKDAGVRVEVVEYGSET